MAKRGFMKRLLSSILASVLIIGCFPAYGVRAENSEKPVYTFEEAKAKYENGEGTLVSCEAWMTGGAFESNYWALANGSMTGNDLQVEAVDVAGQEFDKALNVKTTKKADANWDAQLFFKLTGKIEEGDTLFYGFKMKGISSETNPGTVQVNTRLRPSNDSAASTNFDVTAETNGEWIQQYGSVVSTVNSADSGTGYGVWVMQLGMAAQELQIADLFVVNVSREPGLEEEPEEPGTVYTFEEVMQMYQDGKGELVTYPSLADEGAYELEYQDNINAENFIVDEIEVENQKFNRALNIKTIETGQKAWDAQIYFNMDKTTQIEKGDILFFGCKVRGISSVTNKEAMFVTANTRVRPDRSTSANFDITSYINADDPDDWTQFFGAVAAPAASGDTDGAWVFQLANAAQELDIADVFVINFGKEFSKDQFPVMTKSYLGMEEDAAWRRAALERIEQIRKADVAVEVVDVQGQPVQNAEVQVNQTRHAFGFGTIVNVDSYSKMDSATQEKYKAAFEQIAHNRAGFENALKSNYITDETRQGMVDEWLDYFDGLDIDVRGHVLIYGQDSRLNHVDLNGAKTDLENKDLLTADTEEGKAALREWTKNHIQTYVDKYEGRIYNWDVVNENMTANDWSNRLGGYDALVEWFNEAREADPDVKLTYNDYGILSRDSGHQDYHYNLCKYLVDHDAAMTTIGIQGHVSLISPIEIINILDRFSELGKEIEITEFTYEDDDPELQAQFTRDFMIAVFSEPAVTSLTTWGFWEGCMYQPKAAMVDSNFNLKPNGEVWRDLIYNEWWTDEAGVTGEDGIYSVRAFLGDHDVTVKVGDAVYSCPVELGKDGAAVRVVLDENGNLNGPEAHVHEFGTEWESDETNHWHVCECGERIDTAEHTASEWIVEKEATAEEDGSRYKECTVCGTVMESEVIPKTGNISVPGDDNEDNQDGNNGGSNNGGSNNGGSNNGGSNNGGSNNSGSNNGGSGNQGDGNTKLNAAGSAGKTVKTGDTGNVAFWMMLAVMSGVLTVCGALAVSGRKKRR